MFFKQKRMTYKKRILARRANDIREREWLMARGVPVGPPHPASLQGEPPELPIDALAPSYTGGDTCLECWEAFNWRWLHKLATGHRPYSEECRICRHEKHFPNRCSMCGCE